MTTKPWRAATIAKIRRVTSRPPDIERDGHREWAWDFGAIYTKQTKRSAICVSCGAKIPANTDALCVVHTEKYAGAGWTPAKRFIHLEPCEAK